MKKDTELSKVRLIKGSEFNKSMPNISHEHLFPEINDPELILKCMNDYRKEWDDALLSYDEIVKYRTEYTQVVRALNKKVAGTASREFIDKKIWFREEDTGDKYDENYNDIYFWIADPPDGFWPLKKEYVRANTLIGITRIGKRRDGPGCFYESIGQNDLHLNTMAMKVVGPLMPKGMVDWGTTLRKFLAKKQTELGDQPIRVVKKAKKKVKKVKQQDAELAYIDPESAYIDPEEVESVAKM
jgi:hypothetical protein